MEARWLVRAIGRPGRVRRQRRTSHLPGNWFGPSKSSSITVSSSFSHPSLRRSSLVVHSNARTPVYTGSLHPYSRTFAFINTIMLAQCAGLTIRRRLSSVCSPSPHVCLGCRRSLRRRHRLRLYRAISSCHRRRRRRRPWLPC